MPGSTSDESISNTASARCAPLMAGVVTVIHGTSLSTCAYTHFLVDVVNVTRARTASGGIQVTCNPLSESSSGGGLESPMPSKNCCTAATPLATGPTTG